MAIKNLTDRKIVGAFAAAHFAPSAAEPTRGIITSKAIATWSISATRTACRAGSGIHFTAVPNPASGVFTDSDLTNIFFNTKFRWDFGDVGAPNWVTDGTSSNIGHSGDDGHVYLTAGAYTVTLYVTVGGVESSVATQAITVDNADTFWATTNTICISNNTDFTGAPSGCTQIPNVTSLATALGNIATGKRVLLHDGHVFSGTTGLSSNVNLTNIMLGKFGAGASPELHASANITMLLLGNGSSNKLDDITIRDIKFTGTATNTTTAINIGYYSSNVTIDNVETSSVNQGIQSDHNNLLIQLNINSNRKGVVITNCLFDHTVGMTSNLSGNMHVFAAGDGFTFRGNTLKNYGSVSSHLSRFPYCQHFNNSNNLYVYGSTNSRHCIKLHSGEWQGANVDGSPGWSNRFSLNNLKNTWFAHLPTQYSYIGKNVFNTTSIGQDWSVVVGPENVNSEEEVISTVIANNYFTGKLGNQPIRDESGSCRVRNNVINGSQSPATTLQTMVDHAPPIYGVFSNNLRIHNNSYYKTNATLNAAANVYLFGTGNEFCEIDYLEDNLLYSLPKDAGGAPIGAINNTPLAVSLTVAGNSIDPGVYPFTGTNPPGDLMSQFTLVTPGTGANVTDY